MPSKSSAAREREVLKSNLFNAIDKDEDGYLKEGEMLELAKLVGFEGDYAEWQKEYRKLCLELSVSMAKGIPKAAVLKMLDDESDTGCYCTDKELQHLLDTQPRAKRRERDLGPGYKVHFSNAHKMCTEDVLKQFFTRSGEVRAISLFRHKDGESRGMGNVTYASAKQAKQALRELHGCKVHGRSMCLTEATEGDRTNNESWKGSGKDRSKDGGKDSSQSAKQKQPADSAWYGGYDQWNGADSGWGDWYGKSSRSWEGTVSGQSDGGCTVYFVSAPTNMSSKELYAIFEECGRIQNFWLFKLADGRSRGQGLVEYSSSKEARSAIKYLNGYVIGNRTLKVQEDRVGAMHEDAGAASHGGTLGSQAADWWDGHSVFFSGAPSQMPVGKVQSYFEEYGLVNSFHMFRHPNGRPKGIGVVSFVGAHAATQVLLHGVEIEGWQLHLREAEPSHASQALDYQGADYSSSSWYGYQDEWSPSLDDIDAAKSVFFANVPWHTSEATLWARFEQAGKIQSFHLFSKQDGSSRGMGVVEYSKVASAKLALQTLAETDVEGRYMLVQPYEAKYGGHDGQY
mmetsp:Transcript_65210/g.153550  ORF Transcript_65210/g.153550 Transcript_65210/m.153550 type:complete len:570 (-) Transcript_65210:151-1860(-)